MSSGVSTPAKEGLVTSPRSILKSNPKNSHMLSTPDSGKRPKRRSNSVLGRLRFGSSSSSSNLGKKVGSKSKLDPASASKKWAEGYGDELPPSDQRTPGGRVSWTSDTPDRTKRDYLMAMTESENPGVLCIVNELPDAARLRGITGSPFKVKKGTKMLVIGFTDSDEGTVNVVYNGEKGIYPGELLAPVPAQPTDKAAYWLPPMFRRVFASTGEDEDTAELTSASSGADDAISPPAAYNAPHTASPPSNEGGQRRRGNSFGTRPEMAGLVEGVEDSDADADTDDWQDDESDDETALGGRVRTTSVSSEGTAAEPVPQGFSDTPAHGPPVTVQIRPPRDVNNSEGFKRGGRRNSGTFGFGETPTKKEPQQDTPSPPALESTTSASSMYGFSGVPTPGFRAGSDVSLMDGFSMPETEAENANAPSMRPFLVRKYTEAPPPITSPLDGLDSSVIELEAEYGGFGGSTLTDASVGFDEMLSAADDAYPDATETPRKGPTIDEEEPTSDFASPGITFMENDGDVLSPLSPADKHRNLHDHMKRGMGTRKLSTYDGFGDIRISPLRPTPPRRSSMYDDFWLSSMDFGDAEKSMDDEVGQAEADLDSDDEWAEYGSVARQSVAFGAEGLSEAEHFLVYSNADRSGTPTICGWMRKPNRWTPEGSHLELSKPRWFELHAGVLYYFREIPLDTVESPVGFIQLTEDVAIEHPDDCQLVIVTRQRRYTIFAGSTDQAELWYTACVSACNFDMDAEAEAAVRSERTNTSFDDLQEDADC